MPFPLLGLAFHEVMEEQAESIMLLQRHKDYQWFPHEPLRPHLKNHHRRLVHRGDIPPIIRDQQRQRGGFSPAGEGVCALLGAVRQLR